MKPTLIFVYNADGGLFNALTDIAHKIFSPRTYSCNLCALTHSNFGVRKEWKRFMESLDRPVEFLHADELKARYGMEGLSLPVIMWKEDEKLKILVDADSINACRNVDDLKQMMMNKLSQLEGSLAFDNHPDV
ncbi:MAG: hypothetical protein M3430_07725 [Acidobacteriota bacterium]|nr:hypothetical protein [Acidobacteriota bacterium]